jgi:hypothetical protein
MKDEQRQAAASLPVFFHPSSFILHPFCSCPGRTRTYNRLVNSQLHYRLCYGTMSVRKVGLEPTAPAPQTPRSAAELLPEAGQSPRQDSNLRPPVPETGALPLRYSKKSCSRTSRLSLALPSRGRSSGGRWSRTNSRGVSSRTKPFVCKLLLLGTATERPAGVEPARPRWERGRLPLHHGRVRPPHKFAQPRVAGFEPAPPHEKCGAEPNQRVCTLRLSGAGARDAGRSRTCIGLGCSQPPEPPGPASFREPAVGVEPTPVALRERCSAC